MNDRAPPARHRHETGRPPISRNGLRRTASAAATAALAAYLLTGWLALPGTGLSQAPDAEPPGAAGGPVWSDEFDRPGGAALDGSKWEALTGGLGWGDGELQAYTADPSNLSYNGEGQLVIAAQRAAGAGGAQYTSARITTSGRLEFNHGRVEARIRIPRGTGLWPAFWLLGAQQPWPEHGEIDIFEGVNSMDRAQFNTHQPRSDGSDWDAPHETPVALGGTWADDYHVYAVDWTSDKIVWSIDDVRYATSTRNLTPSDGRWVVDTAPQAIVLNLAVGGMAGEPDDSTVLPARMLVDYVRVYPNADTVVQKEPVGGKDGGSTRGAG